MLFPIFCIKKHGPSVRDESTVLPPDFTAAFFLPPPHCRYAFVNPTSTQVISPFCNAKDASSATLAVCKLEDALDSPFTWPQPLFHTNQKLSEHCIAKLLFCLIGFFILYHDNLPLSNISDRIFLTILNADNLSAARVCMLPQFLQVCAVIVRRLSEI